MNDYYKTCMYSKQKRTKKRKTIVSNKTYQLVYETCEKCVLCGTQNNLQLHHVKYRSERSDLIDTPSNCLMLCINCHNKVHSNKKYWQPILLEICERIYGGTKWQKVML